MLRVSVNCAKPIPPDERAPNAEGGGSAGSSIRHITVSQAGGKGSLTGSQRSGRSEDPGSGQKRASVLQQT
jgi:hypothetical protein